MEHKRNVVKLFIFFIKKMEVQATFEGKLTVPFLKAIKDTSIVFKELGAWEIFAKSFVTVTITDLFQQILGTGI